MMRFNRSLFHIGFAMLCGLILSSTLITGTNYAQGKRKAEKAEVTRVEESGIQAAAPIVVEDFSYSTGDLAVVGAGNGWVVHSGTTSPINVVSPGLTYSGYAGSGVGNAVSSAATGIDMSRQFSAVGSGSVYTAFTISVSNSTTTGDYIFHYLTFGSTSFFRGRVFVKKDASTSNFAFGLSRASGDIAYSATSYTPGTTYLVVLKYTFVAGATNDTVELFVNPTPGGAEPAPLLSAPADVANGDPTTLDAIALRQGGSTSGSTQTIDGIRVATTWAEAVAAAGTPQPANVDMNGDSFTDFVIWREVTPANVTERFASRTSRQIARRQRTEPSVGTDALAGGGNQYEWWIDYNNAPGGVAGVWGLAQVDNIVSADFDGDNVDDVAVWRPGGPGEAGFYSINSSDGTFRYSDFGITEDNPTVVGDYDGDGFDDPATFRCPLLNPGQCYFFYRGSLNNPTNGITYIPWGFGIKGEYFPNPGDFDGDGKYDFCLQDVKTLGQATFWVWINGTETREAIQWGLDSDFVVPGDYDGDGKSDFCVLRVEGDNLVFYILERDGGMRGVQWGIAGDVPAPGDYDGDGKQDIAVHRWNVTDTTFWILPSNGNPYWTFNYGIPGDEPVAKWYVQ